MEFIPARWFHSGRRKPIRLIVIHCTVSPESSGGAEAVARYFATTTRPASAHRTSDIDSTVMSVRDGDTAFAAAGANSDGIHLELVGYPTQTAEEWLDDYGRSMLKEAGGTIREWSANHAIPQRWLSVAEVADGTTRGFCTHHDVSRAFPDVSTGHYDPGPDFPKTAAFNIWFPPVPTTLEDEPMFFAKQKGDDAVFLYEGGRRTHMKSTVEAQAIAKSAGIAYSVADLSADQVRAINQGRVTYL